MYMYWRSEDWTRIDDENKARQIVDELGIHLANAEGRQHSRLVYRPKATTEIGDCFPSPSSTLPSLISSTVKTTSEPDEVSLTDSFRCRLVQTVAYRTLPFFIEQKDNDKEVDNERDNCKDWCVYRFTCRIDPNQSDELAGYLPEAAFFAVRGMDVAGAARWLMLDWTSPSLHRLNELAGLKDRTLSSQQWRDYLIFFVSYLGSSEEPGGLIHPFLIQSTYKEIFNPNGDQQRWAPSPDKSLTSDQHMIANVNALIPESADSDQDHNPPSFEEFAASRELTLFEVKDKAKSFANNNDPFDLPFEKEPDRPNHAGAREKSAKKAKEIVDEIIKEEEKNPKWFKIPETVSQANDKEPLFELIAPMTYRGALFEATLSLYPTGMVRMVEDNPVPGAGWLPAPRWEVRERQDGIHLLCLQAPRRELSVNELRREIREGELRRELSLKLDRPIVEQNKRVMERIEWSFTIKGALVFRDVEFMDDVVLDDCTFERSIQFLQCRFMRGLRLQNATMNGSLILDRSQIEGAEVLLPAKNQQPVIHSLDMRGLRVDRLLSLDRLTVYGQLDGKGLRAANAVHGRGLQVRLREGIDDLNRPAFDFSHASINGPLLLEAHDDSKSGPLDPFRRTIVSGAVSLEGLSAQEVQLNGMVLGGKLDCRFSDISGGIWLTSFQRRTINWRTFVYGSLDLSRAHVGFLYLDGCRVDQGIDLIELRARSIYARGYSSSRPDEKDRFRSGLYRSWIGGDFQASGAVIDNVIEMEGAWIFGEMRFITGRCGRLTLTVHPWWEDLDTPRLTPCEAHGLFLSSFTIDRSVSCVGLRLTKGSNFTWSEGCVLTHGLRIGGSLDFWGDAQFRRLTKALTAAYSWPLNNGSVKKAEDEKAIVDVIAKVRAKISGMMDLSGMHIDGTVNLGNTKIEGPIDLTNAHVGGSLVAFDERSSHHIFTCTGLNARNMQVGGDIDLRGLMVEKMDKGPSIGGNVELQEVKVRGILQLATKNKQPNYELALLVENGSVDLTGVNASQIFISGKSLTSDRREHRFVLERCKVGQLTIGGFVEKEGLFNFPRDINLTAIEVGDWDVNPDTEAAALLKASDPFDARVYLDLDNRLSRQGYTHRANDVYRAMAKKNRETLWSGGFLAKWHAGLSWLNWCFSGNGTVISPMVIGLTSLTFLVAQLLSFPANIEPVEKGTDQLLARQWSYVKALGLAFGHAVPLYKPVPDIAKARLVGPTCWGNNIAKSNLNSDETTSDGTPMEGQVTRREGGRMLIELKRVEIPWVVLQTPFEAMLSIDNEKASVDKCETRLWEMSPHDSAQVVSFIQLILWIFLAGNLPTIMRKRG